MVAHGVLVAFACAIALTYARRPMANNTASEIPHRVPEGRVKPAMAEKIDVIRCAGVTEDDW
eukprot:1346426-Amorphochlora_amoeboformis.AAC.1